MPVIAIIVWLTGLSVVTYAVVKFAIEHLTIFTCCIIIAIISWNLPVSQTKGKV